MRGKGMPTITQIAAHLRQERVDNPRLARLQDQLAEYHLRDTYRLFKEMAEWPTAAEAARAADVHRGQISRLVKNGTLHTNGGEGQLRRIDPVSLIEYILERERRGRSGDSDWARGA